MRVGNQITVMSKAAEENKYAGQMRNSKSSQVVFAGDLSGDFALQDRMRQRKERALERAMKVVNDAWGVDRQMKEEISRSKDHIGALQKENAQLREENNELERQSQELKEAFHGKPESQEQQDLELLKKEIASTYQRLSGVELTEEEKKRLSEIHKKGLSQYQSRTLELEDHMWVNRQEIYRNEKGTRTEIGIETENAMVRGIHEERRKVHPIVDSQQQREKILESAREEIVTMAVKDAKEYLEEEQEVRKEEAEEIKEEKEKQEEILEKRKEKEDELEKFMTELPMDQMSDAAQMLSEVKRQIQNIVSEMNLTVEDIKGTKVDNFL